MIIAVLLMVMFIIPVFTVRPVPPVAFAMLSRSSSIGSIPP